MEKKAIFQKNLEKLGDAKKNQIVARQITWKL